MKTINLNNLIKKGNYKLALFFSKIVPKYMIMILLLVSLSLLLNSSPTYGWDCCGTCKNCSIACVCGVCGGWCSDWNSNETCGTGCQGCHGGNCVDWDDNCLTCQYCNAGTCTNQTAANGHWCDNVCNYCSAGTCTNRTAEDTAEGCSANCQDCGSGTCNNVTENEDGTCTGVCTSCVSGTCTNRGADDTTEGCSANCQDCSGGSCVAVTEANDGTCTGECTYCNAGTCTNRGAEDTTEGCSANCYDCSGGSCVAVSEADDGTCTGECTRCTGGSCVNETNGTACTSGGCCNGSCDTTGPTMEQDFSYAWGPGNADAYHTPIADAYRVRIRLQNINTGHFVGLGSDTVRADTGESWTASGNCCGTLCLSCCRSDYDNQWTAWTGDGDNNIRVWWENTANGCDDPTWQIDYGEHQHIYPNLTGWYTSDPGNVLDWPNFYGDCQISSIQYRTDDNTTWRNVTGVAFPAAASYTGAFGLDWNNLNDGQRTIYFRAADASGVYTDGWTSGNPEHIIRFRKDASAPPTPTITGGTGCRQGTSNTISWGAVTDATSGTKDYYAEIATNNAPFTAIGNSGWITGTSTPFSGLTHGTTYYYRVKARDNALLESGWSGVVSSTQDAQAPPAPTMTAEPTCTAGASNPVSWSAVTTDNGCAGMHATPYWVQIASGPTGGNSGWIAGTSSTFSSLTDGGYCYYVKSRDALGNESGFSAQTCSTQDSSSPWIEQYFSYAWGPGNTNTTHTPMANAYRLRMRLQNINTGHFVVLGSDTVRADTGESWTASGDCCGTLCLSCCRSDYDNQWTSWTGDGDNNIRVWWENAANNCDDPTWQIDYADHQHIYPSLTDWYTSDPGNVLDWPNFYDNCNINSIQYRTDDNGTWRNVTGPSLPAGSYTGLFGLDWATLNDGQRTIYFKVTDVSGYTIDGSASGNPAHIIRFRKDASASSAPTMNGEPACTGGTSNDVSWGGASDPDSGIKDYYAEIATNNSPFTAIGNSGWITGTSTTFGTLTHGTTYYYRVKARSNANLESGWSNVVSSTQDAQAPPAPTISPSLPTYTAGASVSISWGAVSDSGCAGGVQYLVDISPGGDSGWVATSPYTFGSLLDGTQYCFQVKARDALGQESNWSTQQCTTMDSQGPSMTQIESISDERSCDGGWCSNIRYPTRTDIVSPTLARVYFNDADRHRFSATWICSGVDIIKFSDGLGQWDSNGGCPLAELCTDVQGDGLWSPWDTDSRIGVELYESDNTCAAPHYIINQVEYDRTYGDYCSDPGNTVAIRVDPGTGSPVAQIQVKGGCATLTTDCSSCTGAWTDVGSTTPVLPSSAAVTAFNVWNVAGGGEQRYCVRAKDQAGNWSDVFYNKNDQKMRFYYKKDTTAPRIEQYFSYAWGPGNANTNHTPMADAYRVRMRLQNINTGHFVVLGSDTVRADTGESWTASGDCCGTLCTSCCRSDYDNQWTTWTGDGDNNIRVWWENTANGCDDPTWQIDYADHQHIYPSLTGWYATNPGNVLDWPNFYDNCNIASIQYRTDDDENWRSITGVTFPTGSYTGLFGLDWATLNDGQRTIYFKVTDVSGLTVNGFESGNPAHRIIFKKDSIPPTTPTPILWDDPGSGSCNIIPNWGDSTAGSGIADYYLEVCENDSWRGDGVCSLLLWSDWISSSTSQKTLTGALNNRYYYRVKAKSNSGAESAWSVTSPAFCTCQPE